ncbi:phosphoribosyl-AMP cyclohydrolase [Leptospira sp. WS58.C1]|uniref:phosphoribosyl-AMP cyclohydrolase n=1 Tax=Leptospira TaxID=171 RepID=UPI0002BD9224|nr:MULTISPECIES: phosphoribosyl-AMP cyclohydrolase [unclassified Leptospira]EMK00051.1 phosphoribosyl-AMP cyclohydrolase [Leptospira sp. B5-022]MCR1794511.1 phosphoribosyl-AMP cyclohydrolase [Leptospira sp. id769339]
MLTIIWAGGQPGKISALRRMTQEEWDLLRRDLPTNVKTYIDCDEDTILIFHPNFSEKELMEIENFDDLKFSDGLIPVITKDEKGLVLMQAFSTLESLELSQKESMGIYFSRSRNRLWRKGDTSGHIQKLRRILAPKDGSFVVYEVKQEGAACHEGYYSCFFREQDRSGNKNLAPEIPFLGK